MNFSKNLACGYQFGSRWAKTEKKFDTH